MEFVLPALLALPFAVAAVIVAVSSGRRRHHAAVSGPATEPVHRLQSGTASIQSAEVHTAAHSPRGMSGRERRAASATRAANG